MKMKSKIIFILLFMNQISLAQNDEEVVIFSDPETQATIEGGMETFFKYLAQNLKASPNAIKKAYDTKIYISFYVETDGSITEIELVKGNNPELFESAKEVFLKCNDPDSDAPKWISGKVYDEAVRTKMLFPIQVELK